MRPQAEADTYPDCRRTLERRQARMYSLFYGLIRSRRIEIRRQSLVAQPEYRDRHGPFMLALVLAIMLLCVLDSYFTLILISHGSEELNPFLAWALEKDVMLFYSIKYAMTAFFVYILMMHKDFVVFGMKGNKLLLFVLFCYITLISYQLSMLVNLPL